jgi:quinol-cytochrome oxidoreductase complex cytochrome b subunit
MSLISRIRQSINRGSLRGDSDRDRMRRVTNDLVLHLHPRTVPASSLRFTYTFGLGGLSVLLLVVMVLTGTLLMFAYTPSPDEAYSSIVDLQTNVWFGQLIHNIHHWSAMTLLIVAVLHMLRVFYTGAFAPPREFNWQLGLILLFLVVASNFTGYLLPWDQLSYWAVTVGTSMIEHIPVIGPSIRQLLIGGDSITGATLRNFYTLHVILLPLGFLTVGAFHIWRVRKDEITVPPGATEKLTTIPNLINREMLFALLTLISLLAWSTWINAPLDQAADPNNPPDPTKTAWYFAGIQELLFHFEASFGAAIIPGILVGFLILLPYMSDKTINPGIWFRSHKGRLFTLLSFLLGILLTGSFIYLSEAEITFLELPVVISAGFLPVILVIVGLWVYGRSLRVLNATKGEIHMAVFTLLLAAFLTLTIVGVCFRGEGMELHVQ